MDVKSTEIIFKTTVIGTANNTYEVIRESHVNDGSEAIIIQLYPTISVDNPYVLDTTTMHLINKMPELNISKAHVLNLFSKVITQKPLSSDLPTIDEENLNYISRALKSINNNVKVIIAWGNSHITNLIVNRSKLKVLELIMANNLDAYQIISSDSPMLPDGCHILFLGLRYSDNCWQLEKFPLDSEFKRIGIIVTKRTSVNKRKTESKTIPISKTGRTNKKRKGSNVL
ncbi:DUF1643 domain-containing protein [Butyrivibrio sp. NC2002]|uniref:DUF1643 domain-containing protein n=1 Tax=Butyrivibrio sp. NC2002 TaxID=1410610 RepID=UPI00056722B2|nr:DUF1643 domain-containing protein [Butyrivibrio sp. NC2002]